MDDIQTGGYQGREYGEGHHQKKVLSYYLVERKWNTGSQVYGHFF
jgi:hypothetical protein